MTIEGVCVFSFIKTGQIFLKIAVQFQGSLFKNVFKIRFFQVKALQWIPNLVRIKSKLLNPVYKVLCSMIAVYFSTLISCHLSLHSLFQPPWLLNTVLLEPQKTKECFSLEVFTYADPSTWSIFLLYS